MTVRIDANRRLYSLDFSRIASLRSCLDAFWNERLATLKHVAEEDVVRLAAATIDIAAAPDAVFELFTTEQGLVRWMASEATVDLRPGGRWRWVHDNGDASAGEYLEIEPPDRLAFTYGWESGPLDDVPPGSTASTSRSSRSRSGPGSRSSTPACP